MTRFVFTPGRARRAFSAAFVTCLLATGAGLMGLAHAQQASAVLVGQRLPELALKDQHDKPWQVAPSTRLLMFAASRKASNLTQGALQALPKDQMTRRNALYLADMSKMPGFITRTFALPTLEKLPYAIGVSLDEATLATWPRQPDAVTLIELDQGVVKRISYATAEVQVRTALER